MDDDLQTKIWGLERGLKFALECNANLAGNLRAADDLLVEKNRIIDKLRFEATNNDCKAKLLTLRARVSIALSVYEFYGKPDLDAIVGYLRQALDETAIEQTSKVPF